MNNLLVKYVKLFLQIYVQLIMRYLLTDLHFDNA